MANLVRTIEQILPRFASVHDPVSLGAAALKGIEELFPVHSAAIYLLQLRKKNQLELVFAKGLSERERVDAEQALIDGAPERCFQTRQFIIEGGARPSLYQPILSGDVCVGCFALFGNETIQVSDEQKLGLSIIGEICGLTYRQLAHALFARESTEERCTAAETKVREQQKALVLSSRMSAFGKMTSGIGHEINNPLTVIYGKVAQLTDLAENDQLDPKTVLAGMEKIDAMASRIAKIISGMRTVVREGINDSFAPESVRGIVDDTVMFCTSKFKTRGVSLTVNEIPPTLSIDCSASQIAQVLLNLLSNAFDAILQLPEKWITLTVEDKGATIELSVLDSGTGINADIRDRIFDTFFTTKDPGAGTGLGLSISTGIIEGHNGTLKLDQCSANTRFVLTIPKKQPRLEAA